MLVCVFLHNFAHETAGAARIRLSLRPLFVEGKEFSLQTSGESRLGNAAPRLQSGSLKIESVQFIERGQAQFSTVIACNRG
jgi:hypothetical protein